MLSNVAPMLRGRGDGTALSSSSRRPGSCWPRPQAHTLLQHREEFGLERPHRHPQAVGALIDVIKGPAGVEQIDPALVLPHPRRLERPGQGRQQGGAVDHRAVDHLALAGRPRREDPGQHPEGEQHPAAAEIADRVDRRRRRPAGAAVGVERAGERDIVDVVPGGLGERPVLPPAGHPPVDEPRIVLEQQVRPEPEPLHHAGPEPLDQPVGSPAPARAPGRRLSPT